MFDSINTISINPILMPGRTVVPGTSNISSYNIVSADEIHPSFATQNSSLASNDSPQHYSINSNHYHSKQIQSSASNPHMQTSSQRSFLISANCPRSSVSSSPTSHSSLFSASDSQMDILSESNDSMQFPPKLKPACSWDPYPAVSTSKLSSSTVTNHANNSITIPSHDNSSFEKSSDFVDFSPWSFTDHLKNTPHRRQKPNFFNSPTVTNSLTANFNDSEEANQVNILDITESFDKFSLNPDNSRYNLTSNSSNSKDIMTRRNSDFASGPFQYNSCNLRQTQSVSVSTANINSHFGNNEMNSFINNNDVLTGTENLNNDSNHHLNQNFDSTFQSRPSSSHWVTNNNGLSHNDARHLNHFAKSHSLSLPSSNSNSSNDAFRKYQTQQQPISNTAPAVNSSSILSNRPNYRRGNSIVLDSECHKVSNLVNQPSKRPASAHAFFPNGNQQLTSSGLLSFHSINTSTNTQSNCSSSSGSPMYSPSSVFPPMSAPSCPNSGSNNKSHNGSLVYNHSRGGSVTSLNHSNNSNGSMYYGDNHLRRNTVAFAPSQNNNYSISPGNSSKQIFVASNNFILSQNIITNGNQPVCNDDAVKAPQKIISSINDTVIPNNIVITNLTNAANAMTNSGGFALLSANGVGKHTRKTLRNNQKSSQISHSEKEETAKKTNIEKEVLVKYKNVPIKQLESQILMLSKDQNGCRFLQKRIEEYSYMNSPEEVQENCKIIFGQVKTIIQELIVNSFGNYLVQKLFDHLTVEERTEILKICETNLRKIALNQHGTRALQHMIELLTTDEQIKIIVKQLKSHVVELIKNLNGNHVIQKCLIQFNNKKHIQFIVDGICYSVFDVATHRHGCCVLQKTLDYSDANQFQQIGESVLANGLKLLQDAYGNYVVQHLLSSSKHPDSIRRKFSRLVALVIQGHLKTLSVQKYASNVVEKCIKSLNDEALQKELILEVLRLDTLMLLIRDPYGNYVVQAMLDIVLFNDIRSHAIECLSKVFKNIPEDDVYARKIAQRVTDKSQK